MRGPFRLISDLLERFDSEEHEYEVRFQLWKMHWFPYRTYEWLGYDEETLEVDWGRTRWHWPDVIGRRR